MNKKLFPLCITLGGAIMLSLNSCYSDNEEDLYPAAAIESCDTSTVTFSKSVKPIMDKSCVGCHNSANTETFSLEGYEKVKAIVDAGPGLLASINHSKDANPMPKNMPKLSDCKIKTLEKWIKEGAKND